MDAGEWWKPRRQMFDFKRNCERGRRELGARDHLILVRDRVSEHEHGEETTHAEAAERERRQDPGHRLSPGHQSQAGSNIIDLKSTLICSKRLYTCTFIKNINPCVRSAGSSAASPSPGGPGHTTSGHTGPWTSWGQERRRHWRRSLSGSQSLSHVGHTPLSVHR